MTDKPNYSTVIWQNKDATINICKEDFVPNSYVLEVTAFDFDTGRVVTLTKFMNNKELQELRSGLKGWVK